MGKASQFSIHRDDDKENKAVAAPTKSLQQDVKPKRNVLSAVPHSLRQAPVVRRGMVLPAASTFHGILRYGSH